MGMMCISEKTLKNLVIFHDSEGFQLERDIGVIELMAHLFECASPITYAALKEIPRNKRGIYILYTEQDIKYVGQSKASIRARLEHHKATRHFSLTDITKITIIDVPTGQNRREALEAALIWLLKPTFNIKWKNNSGSTTGNGNR